MKTDDPGLLYSREIHNRIAGRRHSVICVSSTERFIIESVTFGCVSVYQVLGRTTRGGLLGDDDV